MPTVRAVMEAIERIAPKDLAISFDRVGLQVGDPAAAVGRGVVSLDRSRAAVAYAAGEGAQVLVSHHPLIWDPLKAARADDHVGATLLDLAKAGIALIAAHTNWDCARGGVNDALAEMLGLQGVVPFGMGNDPERLLLVTYVPAANRDALVDSLAAAGAGAVGKYERCAFLSSGMGVFTPREGANPHVGQVGAGTEVAEARIEMVVATSDLARVQSALLSAHPYEEPAFSFLPARGKSRLPIGRIGELARPMPLGDFVGFVDSALATRSMAWGDSGRLVRTVAAVGGSAADEWRAAQAAGADALVTGEVPQHVALEASESGFALVQAGHFATEQPGCAALAARLRAELPEVSWSLFEPVPGMAGRPL